MSLCGIHIKMPKAHSHQMHLRKKAKMVKVLWSLLAHNFELFIYRLYLSDPMLH